MYDICCIGHITLDKVITRHKEVQMPGGTSFYFSNAVQGMGLKYHLITSVGPGETGFAESLAAKGIEVTCIPGKHTVNFVNIYPNDNPDHREQKVLQKADPFTPEVALMAESRIFHLGPLLADDIPAVLIEALSRNSLISLDAQGFLREVRGEEVFPVDWTEKKSVLPLIHFLKVNETETLQLTGLSDIRKGALQLAEWGVKEVIITLGSKGSLVYDGDHFYEIPAYPPSPLVDATGCGDTYMAGYLSQRIREIPIREAGEFAAAMATLKLQSSGPFTGTEADVKNKLKQMQIVS